MFDPPRHTGLNINPSVGVPEFKPTAADGSRTTTLYGSDYVALEAMAIARMVLESQAWKKRDSYQRLLSDCFLSESVYKEGTVGHRLSRLCKQIADFDFTRLKVELLKLLEDTVVGCQKLTLPSRTTKTSTDSPATSINNEAVVDSLNESQFAAGHLAKHFGDALVMQQLTTDFVQHSAAILREDLGELAKRNVIGQITPSMIYYVAFAATLQQTVFRELYIASVGNAEKSENAVFHGVAPFVTNALLSSIEVGLALELQKFGVDLSETMLKIGRIARGRKIAAIHADRDMEGTIVVVVGALEHMANPDSIYGKRLAIFKHGRDAVDSLRRWATRFPDNQSDNDYPIFPQAHVSLQLFDNGEIIPITAGFDGLRGKLSLTVQDLNIEDGSGGVLSSGFGGGLFIPGICPIFINSSGTFTCGVSFAGMYTALPEYDSNQGEYLRIIQGFFQAKLLEIWRDFPEVMNLGNSVHSISWMIDLNGDVALILSEALYQDKQELLGGYETQRLTIEGEQVVALSIREAQESKTQQVELGQVDVELPQLSHFSEVVRVLRRLGAEIVDGKGSHTGLEYKGRKYTLCKTIRSADGGRVNVLLRKVLDYLQISNQEFVDAFKRQD